jgi:hypothetical protein
MGAGAVAEIAGSGCTPGVGVGVGVCACTEPAPARLSTKTHPGKQATARTGKIETLNIDDFMAGLGLRGGAWFEKD